MSDIKVLALVGSLRAASVNRQIAGLAAETAPAGITVNVYRGLGGGLGELPLYNEDIDNAAEEPGSAHTLRGAVAAADAILVVTPEYNGSIPGGLKNAIDWLSRPYGQNALSAKPLAVIGASMGQYGGVWAHDEARKSFGIAGADVVDAPAFSLPIDALGGKPPRESDDVIASLNDVLTKLAAEAG
jgi:NAD(P)H-dependent FMN reductase